MCGRYSLIHGLSDVALDLGFDPGGLVAESPDADRPRYNIAPGRRGLVVRMSETAEADSAAVAGWMRWGLVPHWTKGDSSAAGVGYRMINARAETVDSKPAFRGLIKSRRCLIPADGFYEWLKLEPEKKRGLKQPWRLTVDGGEVFTMAGLWTRWQPDKGPALESYTIITTTANNVVARIHDRMPVIVDRDDRAAWLDPGLSRAVELKKLLIPFPAERMGSTMVSRLVNSPTNDDARILIRDEDRPEVEPDLFGGLGD